MLTGTNQSNTKTREDWLLALLGWKALSLALTAFFLIIGEARIASPDDLASHGEAKSSGEAILASLITKKKAFKAKRRAFQPNGANNQSSRVFVLDWVVPVSTDLRDYLSNKWKHHPEKPVSISPS